MGFAVYAPTEPKEPSSKSLKRVNMAKHSLKHSPVRDLTVLRRAIENKGAGRQSEQTLRFNRVEAFANLLNEH